MVSLGLVGGVGVMKLNERITDEELRAKVEGRIRGDVRLVKSNLSELRVRKLRVTRKEGKATFTGEMVVPRRRFEYTNYSWQKWVTLAFEPSGELVLPVAGEAAITREPLSSLQVLGSVRPVWSSVKWEVVGEFELLEDAAREEVVKREGANALYDLHFDDFRESRSLIAIPASVSAGSDVLSVLVYDHRYLDAAKAYMGQTGVTLGHDWLRSDFLPKHLAAIRKGLREDGSPEARRMLAELDVHETRRARGDFEPPNDVIGGG